MFSGLRIGEALGLQWKDIDLENKTIKVEKAVSLVPKLDANGEAICHITKVGDTKTACSIREIPLPDILVEILYEWREKQKLNGFNFRQDFINPESFVFCEDNNSVRTYNSCRLAFNRFKRTHGFDKLKIGFHGLRHTFSNMLFESNENPKVIQALLGHKDVRTTISIYNSVDKNYIKRSTEKINNLFKVENPKYLNSKKQEQLKDLNSDELDKLMELIKQRKLEKEFEIESHKRKQEKDFEM